MAVSVSVDDMWAAVGEKLNTAAQMCSQEVLAGFELTICRLVVELPTIRPADLV